MPRGNRNSAFGATTCSRCVLPLALLAVFMSLNHVVYRLALGNALFQTHSQRLHSEDRYIED